MNKTALVTGTTSGIGEEMCRVLAQNKYNLVLVARNENSLKKQADTYRKMGINVFPVACDLATPYSAQIIYNEILSANIIVDILINNAGFNEVGYFANTNLKLEQDMIQVHICALTELTKLLLPGMLERNYGKILNVGSTGSFMACPCDTVYAATKAYILSFSNGLYKETKGTGVSVSCLCPGATKTQFSIKANIDSKMLYKFFVMQSSDVAMIGFKGMIKGKKTIIAGTYNKLLCTCARFLPTGITNAIAQKMITK